MITDRKVSLWIGWLGLLMAGVMVLMVGCNQSNGTDQPQRPQTEGADQVSTADTAQRFV